MNIAFTSMLAKYTDPKSKTVEWSTEAATAPQYSCNRGLYFNGSAKIESTGYTLHSNHRLILWAKPAAIVSSSDIVGCLYSKTDKNRIQVSLCINCRGELELRYWLQDSKILTSLVEKIDTMSITFNTWQLISYTFERELDCHKTTLQTQTSEYNKVTKAFNYNDMYYKDE